MDDLKDIVAAGPALGALQNKLKAVEGLKSRIIQVDRDVSEVLRPMPIVVKKKVPVKPVEIVVEHEQAPPVKPVEIVVEHD